MKQETESKIKYGVWGLICGAIVSMIIGFGWGGWSTASATQKITDNAILKSRTAICVAQFMADPSHEEKFAEFEKTDSWKRYGIIEKAGWDRMPGQEEAGNGVARACADGIEALMKK